MAEGTTGGGSGGGQPEGRGRYMGGWTYLLPGKEEEVQGYGWELFKAMMKEEWRLHRSFVGAVGSGFFPVVIFFFSAVLAVTSPALLRNIDQSLVLLALHLSAVLYGLGVGALALIGEQVMTRRLGQVNMLLQLPQLQPASFKTVMGVFFMKDAAFYILYSIVPLLAGIAVAVPFTSITPGGVALLFVTMLLSFLSGMALSFLVSAVAVRSRAAAGAAGALVACVAALAWPLRLVEPGQVLLPLGYWKHRDLLYLAGSLVLMSLLSASAVLLMKERFSPPERRFRSALLPAQERFSFSKGLSVLVAKEWLELRRSGSLGPVFTGFLGPLLGISAVIWLFRSGMGIPLDFNVVFYGGMVGFLGLMTYSWLTNIEPNEFLNVQPVGPDDVVRAKLVLYFLLTVPISLGYLTALGLLHGEAPLLPTASLVALSTTAYVAAVTGRLTGLRANTMLFDARVLGKFASAVVPPLVVMELASFWMRREPLLASALLAALSAALLVASRLLMAGLTSRWAREPFGI